MEPNCRLGRDWSGPEEWDVERGLSVALAGLAGDLLPARGHTRPPRPKAPSSAAEASGPSSAFWHREGGAPACRIEGLRWDPGGRRRSGRDLQPGCASPPARGRPRGRHGPVRRPAESQLQEAGAAL